MNELKREKRRERKKLKRGKGRKRNKIFIYSKQEQSIYKNEGYKYSNPTHNCYNNNTWRVCVCVS
jgi:hypothetical protein